MISLVRNNSTLKITAHIQNKNKFNTIISNNLSIKSKINQKIKIWKTLPLVWFKVKSITLFTLERISSTDKRRHLSQLEHPGVTRLLSFAPSSQQYQACYVLSRIDEEQTPSARTSGPRNQTMLIGPRLRPHKTVARLRDIPQNTTALATNWNPYRSVTPEFGFFLGDWWWQ